VLDDELESDPEVLLSPASPVPEPLDPESPVVPESPLESVEVSMEAVVRRRWWGVVRRRWGRAVAVFSSVAAGAGESTVGVVGAALCGLCVLGRCELPTMR